MALATDITAKVTGLQPNDFQKLANLPHDVETAVSTAKQLIDAVRSGGSPGNAASAMFKSLATLGDDAKGIPALDQVVKPITSLVGELPDHGLPNIAAIEGSVGDVLALFRPLMDAIASGNVEQAVEKAVADFLALAKSSTPGNASISDAFSDAQTFFELFATIVGWTHAPPSANDAIPVLSTALFGLSHDVLAAPAAALETALAPLAQLVPGGPDATRWNGAADAARAAFVAIGAQAAAPHVDWSALRTAVNAAHAQLLDLIAARDRAYALALAAITGLRLGPFDSVATAVAGVPPAPPRQANAAIDGIRRQLQGFADALGALDLSPDDARTMVRDFVHRHTDAIAGSALGDVRVAVVNVQQRLLELIDGLPFAGLADEVHAALAKVAGALQLIDPDLVKKPLHEFFTSIEAKLDGFDRTAIKDAIKQVWDAVDQALNAVKDAVNSVVHLIDQAIAHVGQFIQDAQPAIDEITQAVTAIEQQIENFDLESAAQTVVAEIERLKGVVAAIDTSKLPAPAVGLLKKGADALRQIDVAGAINPPLSKELDKIDPTPALEQALKELSTVTDVMEHINVSSLAGKLDAPVNELLAKLNDFGPEGIKKLIEAALQPVKDALKQLDAAVLLKPLIAVYRELMAKVDALLDPDAIFAPLEKLYKPVLDAIDFVEPFHVLSLLEPHGGSITTAVQSVNVLPDAVGQGTTALKNAISTSAVQADDKLLGMRPGDLLIPLIDVHHAIMNAVTAVHDDALAAAGGHLFDALAGRLAALDPLAIHVRVRVALDAVVRAYDPLEFMARAQDAIIAYERARGAIEVAASAQLSAGDAVIAADVRASLPAADPRLLAPSAAQRDGLLGAAATVTASLDLSAVAPAAADLARSLGPVIAPLASLTATGADEVRSLLASLDPTPVRDEINALFEELGAKIVQTSDVLEAILDEIGKAIEEFVQPFSPGNILRLAQTLHAELREQVVLVGPAAFKDDVRRVFDIVKSELAIADPQQLVDEINGLRDHLIGMLDTLVTELLPDRQPFDELLAAVAQIKPSILLGQVTGDLTPLTELAAKLSPEALLKPIIDAIAHVKGEVPAVVEEIVAALDDVLAAFPDGGSNGAAATATASV
ncbi:MAG TPA: hypothetical protein VK669_08350 [Candidatus Limnocylindrales bacterium]|nr:hypothetical protein [Candidatus Limnocylindrales bacterium]